MKLFGGKNEGGHAGRSESRAKQSREQDGFAGFLRKHRTPLIVLGCVVLVILAVLAVHAVLVKAPERRDGGLNAPSAPTIRPAVTENLIATPPPEELPPTPVPEPTETPEPTREPGNYRKENCYTFVLLVRDQVSGSTDSILVGRMDTEEGKLDFVNIPRDTLVNVAWAVKKANTIYVNEREDPERFISHLSGLIGFDVDNYAVMNLGAVEAVVNAMGGVWYDMPRSMDYDDPTQDLHIHISAGPQQLSGSDVVKALRFRVGNDGSGYPDGDIGRINFQHGLLKALLNQFLSLGNIPNLPKIIEVFEENVKTDLTANNLAFYAERFLLMDRDSVRFHTAPGTGIAIRGGSYYELDLGPWVAMINEALNPYSEPVTENNLDVLHYLGVEGAISTTGDVRPLGSFYDFYSYSG